MSKNNNKFDTILLKVIFDREQRSKSGLKNCLVVVVGLVVVQYFLN